MILLILNAYNAYFQMISKHKNLFVYELCRFVFKEARRMLNYNKNL